MASLLLFGINHRTAPLDVREQVALATEQLPAALDDLRREVPGTSEALLVSTCNRTEVICVTGADTHLPVLEWLARDRGLPPGLLEQHSYVHWDEQAARHLMRVASGLDSQILGEPQILGQVKRAIADARAAGSIGGELDRLCRHVLAIAKKVRSDTGIGRNPVSVAYAAVTLAKQIFGQLQHSQGLLVGAGETIELVARHLNEAGIGSLVIANRTLDHAEELAASCGARAVPLAALGQELAKSDVVITSTGATRPVLGKGLTEQALRARKRRPMFMVDIAVPRDIEPQVAELADVYLYTIDDLTGIVEENSRARADEAAVAEDLVQAAAVAWVADRNVHDARDLLRTFRSRAQRIQADELVKAQRRLAAGDDPEAVLAALARTLTNKLMHGPTVALRSASANGRSDLVDLAGELFDLDPPARDRDSNHGAG